MKRPIIEKIKSRLRSALNNAKYMTTGNLPHNKACVEMMVEYSLNEIDNIVVEERDRCIKAAQDFCCRTCNYKFRFGSCPLDDISRCDTLKNIRKAIEE